MTSVRCLCSDCGGRILWLPTAYLQHLIDRGWWAHVAAYLAHRGGGR